VYENLEKLPTLHDLNQCKQNLLILDDMVTDIKKNTRLYLNILYVGAKMVFYNILISIVLLYTKNHKANVNYVVILKLDGTNDMNT
jgi:hypothetical protein